MARTVYKVDDDDYLLWSDNADAPVSYVLTRAEIRQVLLADDLVRHSRTLQALREKGGDDEDIAIADAELALAERKVDQRLARTDRNGTSEIGATPRTLEQLLSFNRAGPGESRLTPQALLRRYASERANREFELQPGDIAPYWTNDWDAQGRDIFVWVPWKPGQQPAQTTSETDLRARVPMDLDDIAELVSPADAQRIAQYA